MKTPTLLEKSRPWPFKSGELNAGLRRFSGDSSLLIKSMEECPVEYRQPAMGSIRGLKVTCIGSAGEVMYQLVIKEPRGVTRAGMAGGGRREVSIYRVLGTEIPIHMPQLVAGSAGGEWLAVNMVNGWRDPIQWTADDYLHAIDNLVILHDRFWNLGEDLAIFVWLGRPLSADLQVYARIAQVGFDHMMSQADLKPLFQNVELLRLLSRVVRGAGKISRQIQNMPPTLLHGEYYPGNLLALPNGDLITFDWQRACIAPGIIDLVNFVQLSRWWYDRLPLPISDIIHRYRSQIGPLTGCNWSDEEWQRLWDHTLMWVFLTDWLNLISASPLSLIETRRAQLETVWLKPVLEAAIRRNADL